MRIRDRIKELRRVKAAELRPNPSNWRTHPVAQREALQGILAEVGYADALLARELSDGSLELIDGHLRAETTPDEVVPVLVLDVDEAEARKILATLDPLAAMAQTDAGQLNALLGKLEVHNRSLSAMLASLADQSSSCDDLQQALASDETDSLRESYHVLIECADEHEQRALLERLSREGLACRAVFV